MKLELKHIAPYLPYDLQMVYIVRGEIIGAGNLNRVSINRDENHPIRYDINYNDAVHEWMFKPILKPISSMTKEEAYEFGILLMGEADMKDKEIGIGEMRLMGATYPTIVYKDKEDEEYSITIQFSSVGISGIDLVPYEAYEWLFDHHFDVFNLIENNLAIAK